MSRCRLFGAIEPVVTLAERLDLVDLATLDLRHLTVAGSTALDELDPADAVDGDPGDTYAVALRWTALDAAPMLDVLPALSRARDWQSFRAALASWTVPGQNFVYADVDGDIGYQATGQVPVRGAGDGRLPVPRLDRRPAMGRPRALRRAAETAAATLAGAASLIADAAERLRAGTAQGDRDALDTVNRVLPKLEGVADALLERVGVGERQSGAASLEEIAAFDGERAVEDALAAILDAVALLQSGDYTTAAERLARASTYVLRRESIGEARRLLDEQT